MIRDGKQNAFITHARIRPRKSFLTIRSCIAASNKAPAHGADVSALLTSLSICCYDAVTRPAAPGIVG